MNYCELMTHIVVFHTNELTYRLECDIRQFHFLHTTKLPYVDHCDGLSTRFNAF